MAALGAANGRHLHRLATASTTAPVVPDQRAKSIGHEETFARDHHRLDTLQRELVRLADAVAARLRARRPRRAHRHASRCASTTSARSPGRPRCRRPVDTGPDVARAATELLGRVDPAPGSGCSASREPARRTGVGPPADASTTSEAPSWDDATGAIDAIRARFGADAIVPASLAGPDGIRVKQRGDQQWGPTDRHRVVGRKGPVER